MFARLKGQPRSLTFYVDFALSNYREPEKQKSLADAVAEYIKAKEHEFAQDQLSPPQMARIRWDLKRLREHFAGKAVADLTVSGLVAFLEMGRPGMKTHNNRRGILSMFLKFASHRGRIAENPILKVPHHRIRRRRVLAQTFTAAQARELMEYFETFEGAGGCRISRSACSAASGPASPTAKSTSCNPTP